MRPRSTRLSSLLAATIACIPAACAAPDAGPAEAPPGAWAPEQAWRLEESVRIGSADGGGPDEFAWVVDVELDGQGRVWVADGQQNQVHVFDSAGTYVRSFGRKGGGPEEFDGIAGMAWGPSGDLWVLDGGNMRFAVYDTTGTLVTTHRREVNVVTSPWPFGFDAEGRLHDMGSFTSEEQATKVMRLGPGLVAQDSFLIPAFQEQFFELVQQDGGNRSVNRVTVPFTPTQVWRVDPEGNVWIGVTDRYRLERHRFEGGVDRVLEGTARARPVTAEDRETALANYSDFTRRGGTMDPSRIPETHELFTSFFFGDERTVWVKLSTERSNATTLDVFDDSGAYLGRVQAPSRMLSAPAPAFRDGRMAAVVVDEDGVPAVAVMRVVKPGA